MKKSRISPAGLRSLLIVLILLLIGFAAVGFYFAQNALVTYSKVVTQTVADSTNSGKDVQSLKKLQSDLSALQEVIAKTSNITATAANYQSQVIIDISTYAQISGINVSKYTFTQVPVAAVIGVPQSSTVTLALTSPMPYVNLLKFLRLIETNLPKMQVSSVNLTRIAEDSSTVHTDSITIDVYTK
jgi:ribosomal protein L30E